MPHKALAFLCCLVLVAAAIGNPTPSAAAQEAPSFELESLQGENVSLQELTADGRHLLLVFWTTWCPSCRKTMPQVNQIALDSSRDDLSVLGINAGWNDSRSKTVNFRDKHELSFPIGFDHNSRITEKFGIRGVPSLFLIGPENRIRYLSYGVDNQLLKLLERIGSD